MTGKSLSSRRHLGASFSHFVCSVFSFWFRKKLLFTLNMPPRNINPGRVCLNVKTSGPLRFYAFERPTSQLPYTWWVMTQMSKDNLCGILICQKTCMTPWEWEQAEYAGPLHALHRQMRCNKKFKERIVVHLSSLHINNISLYLFLKTKQKNPNNTYTALSCSLTFIALIIY